MEPTFFGRLKAWVKRREDFFYPAAVIGLFYGVLFACGITCPIKFVTGVSCPGCGMTRAWLSVLRLDFAAALHYHPLFWAPPLALAVFFGKPHINCVVYRIIMLTLGAAFIILYACRLMCAGGDVVVFEPENNIVFRILGLK